MKYELEHNRRNVIELESDSVSCDSHSHDEEVHEDTAKNGQDVKLNKTKSELRESVSNIHKINKFEKVLNTLNKNNQN